ncbi:universal stress protein [Actinocorallia sp. API 0066]|uniref:universal stress protein n=1 Tax=Actinocorallia sp. API 0066 TaxID=2896846 RepID=UPI001E49722A|nr:universal stress protein [Actinocorallia sp. API 0066]MCD0450175.1 universal stress protein [Actinocorallia sp. API 0066]
MAEALGVLVGYDGSEGGDRALEWAAQEASARGLSLTICHVWQVVYPGFTAVMPMEAMEETAAQLVGDAAAKIRTSHPGLDVLTRTYSGSPAYTLIDLSQYAELTVVGSLGLGAVRRALIGSVGAQVAAHADGVVTVVRGDDHPEGPVVAGLDGSRVSAGVLLAALEEAKARGVGVTALCVYPGSASVRDTPFVTEEGLREIARARFDRAVAEGGAAHPDVPVEARFVDGDPTTVLIESSEGARALVVGARSGGTLRKRLLGSSSEGAIHHALCPVSVVHPPHEHAE